MKSEIHPSKEPQPARSRSKRRGFLSSLTRLEESEMGGDSWFVSVCLASLIFSTAYVLIEMEPDGIFNVIAYILAFAAVGVGTVILIRNLLAPYFSNWEPPSKS